MIEPVPPIKISNAWYLITRPTFSLVSSPESTSGQSRTTGSSDLVTQLYFSPQVQLIHMLLFAMIVDGG